MKKNLLFILILPGIIVLLIITLNIFSKSDKNWNKEYLEFLSREYLPINQRIKTAENYLEEAIKRNDHKEIVNANLIIGNLYQSKFDYHKSVKHLLNAYRIANEKVNEKVLADICYKISNNYLINGEYITAHEFAIRTDSIEKNNQLKSPETLNLLGNIYEKTGLYLKSLAAHYESLELQKEDNNLKGIANSYHNLANLYVIGERFDKAYTYYSKALEIYQKLDYTNTDSTDIQIGIAKIQMSLGSYFSRKNDSDMASLYLNKALEVFSRANSKINIAQAYFNIGNLYFQTKDYQNAFTCYLKSIEINDSISNTSGVLAANSNLARIYYVNNQHEKAIETFKLCLNKAVNLGAKGYVAEISEALYYIMSEYPDSIEQTKEYASVFFTSKNYMPNETMQDSIVQMSVKHEVTLQKNEEIELERSKKNTTIVLMLSLMAVIMLSSVFIYFNSRARQRSIYEKKLAEEQLSRFKEVFNAIENERKRIAVDLHDSLGQMLSTTKLYLSGLEDFAEEQNESNKKLYKDSINLLDESCSELRNISYNIMPSSFIKYGLIVAIRDLGTKINNSNKIKLNINISEYDSGFNESMEIVIYRIIQEALNNIIKHANATEVNLSIKKENQHLNLSIHDNGKGMENIEFYKNKGLGWKSIYSRVQMLNGKIDVNTAVNKGTKIEVSIPIF